MKMRIVPVVCALMLLSCKTTQNNDISQNKATSNCHIEVEVVPSFGFVGKYILNEKNISEDLFSSFTILKIYENSKKNNQHYYYEIVKNYNRDVNLNRFSNKENKYVFYKSENQQLKLVSAEINYMSDLMFNNSKFSEQESDNPNEKEYREMAKQCKIKYNNSLIDIGMKKDEFARIFNRQSDKLCDTINVHNDTDESWYLFKNDVLDKIIIDSYTH